MNQQSPLSPESLQGGQNLDNPWSELRDQQKVVVVRCAGTLYGIALQWVRETRPFHNITPVYGLPAFWVGITALRGELYAVLDLQHFLFSQQTTIKTPMQIVFTAVKELSIGLLVEEIPDVRPVDVHITVPSPSGIPYLWGATSDLITLLDLPGLFADPRLTSLASHLEGREV